MPSDQKLIDLFRDFYYASNNLLTDICLVRNQILLAIQEEAQNIKNNKDVNITSFMKISRSPYSPDKIAKKFSCLSKDFLNLSEESLSFMDLEGKLALQFTQEHISPKKYFSSYGINPDSMIVRLNVVGDEWKEWFPQKMSYMKSKDYFIDHQDDLIETLDIAGTAYEKTKKDIKDIVIPNTALLLNTLGIEIK